MTPRFLIFFLIILFVEIYFLQAVRTFTHDFSPGKRHAVLYTAYGLALLSIVIGVVSMFYPPPNWMPFFRFFVGVILILALCKLIGISFLIIDDVIRLFRWIFSFIIKSPDPA